MALDKTTLAFQIAFFWSNPLLNLKPLEDIFHPREHIEGIRRNVSKIPTKSVSKVERSKSYFSKSFNQIGKVYF